MALIPIWCRRSQSLRNEICLKKKQLGCFPVYFHPCLINHDSIWGGNYSWIVHRRISTPIRYIKRYNQWLQCRKQTKLSRSVNVLAVRCFSKYYSANIFQQIFFSKYSSAHLGILPAKLRLAPAPPYHRRMYGSSQVPHCSLYKKNLQLFCDLPNCLQIFLTYCHHFFDVHKQDQFANLPAVGLLLPALSKFPH